MVLYVTRLVYVPDLCSKKDVVMAKSNVLMSKKAAVSLANSAPRMTLTETEELVVERYVGNYYANEEARFYAVTKDPNKEWTPPTAIETNLMTHQIACEIAICELLDIEYLPRHQWRERKDLGLTTDHVIAFLFDTQVKVCLRLPDGPQGVYVHISDALQERLVLWGEVRLKDCQCFMCDDAEPRPETRARLLGGVEAYKELWYESPKIRSHKDDKERFVGAEKLTSPYELLDEDGFPLVEMSGAN